MKKDIKYNIPKCFYRLSVKIFVKNKDWKILFTSDKNWVHSFLWWWLNYWEDVFECIKREIKEESWLDLLSIEETPSYFIKFEKEKYHQKIHVAHLIYKAEIWDITKFKKSDECYSLNYYSVSEVKNLKLWLWIKELFNKYDLE